MLSTPACSLCKLNENTFQDFSRCLPVQPHGHILSVCITGSLAKFRENKECLSLILGFLLINFILVKSTRPLISSKEEQQVSTSKEMAPSEITYKEDSGSFVTLCDITIFTFLWLTGLCSNNFIHNSLSTTWKLEVRWRKPRKAKPTSQNSNFPFSLQIVLYPFLLSSEVFWFLQEAFHK